MAAVPWQRREGEVRDRPRDVEVGERRVALGIADELVDLDRVVCTVGDEGDGNADWRLGVGGLAVLEREVVVGQAIAALDSKSADEGPETLVDFIGRDAVQAFIGTCNTQ